MYTLLDTINSPQDIKSFNIEQLKQLCSELRQYIIESCAVNPGHLASSLGSVELIVGMHYVFDAPSDKLVFDVGHQAYAHKILTGRREQFKNLRTENGLSGFPNRTESEYDSFSVGHSSTSISAALGMTYAAKLQGREEKVLALIGDGAMTGGLAFEGLNNAGIANADLLVLLNDNNQSIDNNIGAMHEHLMLISTSSSYNKLKTHIWNFLGDHGFRGFVQRWLKSFKSWIVKRTGGDIFESLGFRYFGPIDGNNIEEVVLSLKKLRRLHGPRLLHCLTVKGKGYPQAEADPVTWHAPGKFDPATGQRLTAPYIVDRYQDVFGRVLCDLAKIDSKVVGITPAMAQGCGMSCFAAEFPERFFDVGIEEEHSVTFSAGLAAGGMKPFCNIYSSFSQRAYDQIIHDVAFQGLPVVLCFDRAGLVGEDGATHQGVYDIAAYRSIPGAIIASPRNELELKNLMYSAYLNQCQFQNATTHQQNETLRPKFDSAQQDTETQYSKPTADQKNAELCLDQQAPDNCGRSSSETLAKPSDAVFSESEDKAPKSFGPYIIRYPRGMGEGVDWKEQPFTAIPTGKSEIIQEGSEVAIIATGPVVNRAIEAAQSFGTRVGVYNFRFVKPLDEELLEKICKSYKKIITVEDGCLKGGLYGAICEFLCKNAYVLNIEGIGIADEFVHQAKQKDQLAKFGIDKQGIEKKLKKVLQE